MKEAETPNNFLSETWRSKENPCFNLVYIRESWEPKASNLV